MKKHIPYVTYGVGILCVVIYALQWGAGCADTSNGMILFGAYYKPFILAGEYWRFLSVGLVHANIWHLLINMMSLYALGKALEPYMKRWKYLVLLVGSTVGSAAFLFVVQGNVLAVGISGGLYGLMTTYFILLYRSGGLKDARVRNIMISTLLMNLLINFMPGVSWVAHLGGAIAGFFLTEILLPDIDGKKKQRDYAVAGMALLIALGYFGYQNAYIPNNQAYLYTDYMVLSEEAKYVPASYIQKMAKRLDAIYDSNTILQDALTNQEA